MSAFLPGFGEMLYDGVAWKHDEHLILIAGQIQPQLEINSTVICEPFSRGDLGKRYPHYVHPDRVNGRQQPALTKTLSPFER